MVIHRLFPRCVARVTIPQPLERHRRQKSAVRGRDEAVDNPGDGIEELAVLAELQAMFERLTDVEPSIEVADPRLRYAQCAAAADTSRRRANPEGRLGPAPAPPSKAQTGTVSVETPAA